MPPATQHHRGIDPNDASCHQLIEALADGNPIPDTSTICPERYRLIALLAEISKGERSVLSINIEQVARRRGLSICEIAARATFLLACLDTPGADDPYTILGVNPTATSDEIKAAWLSLVSLYHPDRHQDNSDWFTRHSARLNEAYQTLKDPARRHTYDERRRRERLAMQDTGPLPIHHTSALTPFTPPSPSQLRQYRAPAIAAAIVITAAGFITMAMTNRHETEPKLYLDTTQTIVKDGLMPAASTSAPRYRNPSEVMTPSLEAAVIPPADQPSKSARMITRALHTSTPVDPSGTQRNAPNRPVASARSSANPMLLAQALPPIVAEPKGLDRPEIDQLLDEYIDAYEKADVERLMATLSTRVREKGTMDYQAIRNAYVKGFTGRDQFIYRLKNVQVDIKGEQATVIAQYLISARVVAQNAKPTTVSGRIEWKLHREGDKLKIVAINY
jgi:hypothetical protein